MNHSHYEHTSFDNMVDIVPQLVMVFPFVIGFILYIRAVIVSNRRYRRWPIHRTVCWILGVICATIAVAGPVAQRGHVDFTVHMVVHLLLGMLAPLLFALAAPMTLALRSIHVTIARKLSRMLRSRPFRILSDPAAASLLNIGGLWIIYTTPLYEAMLQSIVLHTFIHVHVFLAGYLFTISIIYIDPRTSRSSYVYRSIVLVISLAGHSILSKYIYAQPPAGVLNTQAESGGMLMYYGGDAVDMILICIFCYQWYRDTRSARYLIYKPQ